MEEGFFESLYQRAEGDDTAVPWQHAVSRRLVGDWLAGVEPGSHRRALVVAAGLGDDAAALAGRGLEVVAFDVAPTAVDWARRRHRGAPVDWHVADLFELPEAWREAFDLVLEVFTVQSVHPTRQVDAAAAIRATLAPGGRLVVVAVTVDGDGEPSGPPWPLRSDVVEALVDGLVAVGEHREALSEGVHAVRLELERS